MMPWEETDKQIRSGHKDSSMFEIMGQKPMQGVAGIMALFGKPKDDPRAGSEVISFIFDKSEGWTMEKAKKWYAEHEKKASETFDFPFINVRLSEIGPNGTKWYTVFPFGEWRHPQYGKIKMTPEIAGKFVKAFKDNTLGRIPVVEVEHEGATTAAGWPKDAKVGNTGLEWLIEWTQLGESLIKDKLYQYFSPEYGAVDKQTGKFYEYVMSALALTNKPFLTGLQALALSENYMPGAVPSGDPVKAGEAVETNQGAWTEKILTLSEENEKLTEQERKEFDELKAQLVDIGKTTKTLSETIAAKDAQIKELSATSEQFKVTASTTKTLAEQYQNTVKQLREERLDRWADNLKAEGYNVAAVTAAHQVLLSDLGLTVKLSDNGQVSEVPLQAAVEKIIRAHKPLDLEARALSDTGSKIGNRKPKTLDDITPEQVTKKLRDMKHPNPTSQDAYNEALAAIAAETGINLATA